MKDSFTFLNQPLRLSILLLMSFSFLSDPLLFAQLIKSLRIIQQTSRTKNAKTDDNFKLILRIGSIEYIRDFPDIPNVNERERGRTDTYNLDISSWNIDKSSLQPENIFIRTLGSNAWLPSYFKVIAVTNIQNYNIVDRSWPSTNWFSKDPSDVVCPNLALREWHLGAGANNASSSTSLRITLRHITISTISIPQCNFSVQVEGSLLLADASPSCGIAAFSGTVSYSGTASIYSESDYPNDYYCDAIKTFNNLRPGTWKITYFIGNQVGTCNVTLPAELNRVNFVLG